jgi:dipeptidyl aminopeptidase/acylaminoacyl peptidase
MTIRSAPVRALLLPSALLLLCAVGLRAPSTAAAQEKPSKTLLTVDHYLDWERVSDPQISPDGRRIVYTRQYVDHKTDKWVPTIWIIEDESKDGSARRQRYLVDGSSGRFSPDGTRIAYLAETAGSGTQVFVLDLRSAGPATQVTRVEETPGNLRWSPDGRFLSFTMLVPKTPSWKIDMPAAPKGATWTDPPRIIETTHYRADRQGFVKEAYLHLFVVPAEGGHARAVTEGAWNVGARTAGIPDSVGYDWTPDSRAIVFDASKTEDADRRYRESEIYAVDVATGAERRLTEKRGPWTGPVVSPDGRFVAFTGDDAPHEATYHAADLFVVGLDGKGMRRVPGTPDRDLRDLKWAPDGSGVYTAVEDHGRRNIVLVPLQGSGVRAVTRGQQSLTLDSVSKDGLAVGVRAAPLEPDDIARFALQPVDASAHPIDERSGEPTRVDVLTHVNGDILDGMKLGQVEEMEARTPAGPVQGWIVKPPDFDNTKKYPLILYIHGGPHAMYGVGFNYSFQNLAANGYVVLYINPRGSTGYGSAFGNAIDDAYPGVDFDDLMASVDEVVGRGYVDTSRLYVTGVSGGGVLSAWCTSHTQRFAAAAVRAPVIDWISFAGTTDITAWGYFRYHGRFWDDPSKWLAHSPLMHVAKVKTPTLLMTGELDLRTPIGQTEEYYQALRAVGVPTAMIRFSGEYHGTQSLPSNFMRTQLYLMSWFDRYPPKVPPATPREPETAAGAAGS